MRLVWVLPGAVLVAEDHGNPGFSYMSLLEAAFCHPGRYPSPQWLLAILALAGELYTSGHHTSQIGTVGGRGGIFYFT